MEGNSIDLKFKSEEAEKNFKKTIEEVLAKQKEVKENVCGDCAAYPCFRNPGPKLKGALCYQTVRSCRQECDHFLQERGSGSSPDFQITGKCQKDGKLVDYDQTCNFVPEEKD